MVKQNKHSGHNRSHGYAIGAERERKSLDLTGDGAAALSAALAALASRSSCHSAAW